MIIECKIPTPGESITEVEIANWMVEDGSWVNKNEEIAEIESDKATLVLVAEESGIIHIQVPVGKAVAVGTIACTINTTSKQPAIEAKPEASPHQIQQSESKREETRAPSPEKRTSEAYPNVKVTPVAAEIMRENDLNIEDIINGLRRIQKQDVQTVMTAPKMAQLSPSDKSILNTMSLRDESREKMSMLRRRLSERLVSVKNETAMLTTFNEVDMSALMDLRQKMQSKFTEKYGFKLGFMGFFTKAVSIAAGYYPTVNSRIEGEEIVQPSYVDVGIAVQAPKGLMVPVVRNAESKSVAEIELNIKDLAQKARDKKITIEELSGGTFSITNGGVFGSLLSTPIINPPQSAILGMHNIFERPVALNGQVVIRPMMYVALSYDHRIIDGKDSVGFLVKVKEMIEHPERMIFNGTDPSEKLLEI